EVFGDADRMADTLTRIAGQYKTKAAAGTPELPKVANVRLALNVAACDNQPLVVLLAPDAADRKKAEAELTALAWSDEFLGRFVYAVTADAKDMTMIEGVTAKAGLIVVQPDRFGQKGKVLVQKDTGFATALTEALTAFQKTDKTFANHVRQGQQAGVFWETKLPVTDPMERQARERGRQK